jgi:hypothetical protein
MRIRVVRLTRPSPIPKSVRSKFGKLADLAVLSQDIFSAAPETIGKTRVIMTLIGGKRVYEAAP